MEEENDGSPAAFFLGHSTYWIAEDNLFPSRSLPTLVPQSIRDGSLLHTYISMNSSSQSQKPGLSLSSLERNFKPYHFVDDTAQEAKTPMLAPSSLRKFEKFEKAACENFTLSGKGEVFTALDHLTRKRKQNPSCSSSSSTFQCTTCLLCFSKEQELNLHIIADHFPKVRKVKTCDVSAEVKKFFCGVCGMRFALERSLWKHNLEQHNKFYSPVSVSKEMKFSCKICNRPFYLRESLRQHNLAKHIDFSLTE